MEMRLRSAGLAPLVFADHDRAHRAVLHRVAHDGDVGLDEPQEMLFAERASAHQIAGRARLEAREVTRVLDHDVRLVASAGELGRDAWKEVVEHAHHPLGARARAAGGLVALPLRELGGRDAQNFRRRHRLVTGTEWARRLRLRDRRGAERGCAGVEFAAAAQREGEALAAHVDDVGDDAGHRVLDPDQRAVANFVFNRHPSILSLGAAGFSTRMPVVRAPRQAGIAWSQRTLP